MTWVNTPYFDYSAGFQAIYFQLVNTATNVSMVDHGAVTMANSGWKYQTCSFVQQGRTYYQTCALNYYSNAHRGYEMDFIYTNNSTLSSLMLYGDTFTQ